MVHYSIGGTARSADITYETPTGTSQQTGIDVPIHRESDGGEGLDYTFGVGDHVYLSAQNTSGTGGTITCTITADGTQISQNQADGEGAIATCDGEAIP